MDVHSASCTTGVLSAKGKRLSSTVLETNGKALVEFLRLIPGTRRLIIEEGTQAAWLYEILSPHVHEMVVMSVPKSKGQKNTGRFRPGREAPHEQHQATSVQRSRRVFHFELDGQGLQDRYARFGSGDESPQGRIPFEGHIDGGSANLWAEYQGKVDQKTAVKDTTVGEHLLHPARCPAPGQTAGVEGDAQRGRADRGQAEPTGDGPNLFLF
jgi:hypothetical protein